VYVRKRRELVNADAQDQWKSKESVLQACYEVCGKKKESRKHVVVEWIGQWSDSMKESCVEKDFQDCYWEKQDPIQEHAKTSKGSGWESNKKGDWTAIRGI